MSDWISVKDRLPRRGYSVLVYVPSKPGQEADGSHVYLEMARGDPRKCSGWLRFNSNDVTYWMPLPEPPTGEEP